MTVLGTDVKVKTQPDFSGYAQRQIAVLTCSPTVFLMKMMTRFAVCMSNASDTRSRNRRHKMVPDLWCNFFVPVAFCTKKWYHKSADGRWQTTI